MIQTTAITTKPISNCISTALCCAHPVVYSPWTRDQTAFERRLRRVKLRHRRFEPASASSNVFAASKSLKKAPVGRRNRNREFDQENNGKARVYFFVQRNRKDGPASRESWATRHKFHINPLFCMLVSFSNPHLVFWCSAQISVRFGLSGDAAQA
jgi:hypothetical protein